MSKKYPSAVAEAAERLKRQFKELKDKRAVLRSAELKQLYEQIPKLPVEERAEFGQAVNRLKQELERMVQDSQDTEESLPPIDVTAPFDSNVTQKPQVFRSPQGSKHPLMTELERVVSIFEHMGFDVHESRQLDDDYHMFESLNFPTDHPARDDYDTFSTEEGLIAPAHTSTMQNRILKLHKSNLDEGKPISAVIPGRVFRNEDVDARHEHTFYQLEGVYVDKGIHAGHLIATLKTFLESYYEQELDVKTQPSYFPFTEPSFEFALSCPFCQKEGCNICSYSGWIELLGCGLIHPNVLKMADIDPEVYTGFAWGGGIERLVMFRYSIEDIRHFQSAKLEFLRQFS